MKKLILLFLALGLLAWQGCKRCDDPTNPECRNYDPCYELTEVSADFEMREYIGRSGDIVWDLSVTTGKVLNRNALVLTGLDSGDVSHQWIIGTDPRVRSGIKEVVTFGGFTGAIEITHIVSGNPRQNCFPDDDGVDTVTKVVEIVSFEESMPYFGTYEGVNLHQPRHPFSIEIYYVESNMYGYPDMAVKNLPSGCDSLLNHDLAANGFFVLGGGWPDFKTCWGLHAGLAQISANADTLVIHYRYDDPDSLALDPPRYVTKESVFIGYRQ